MAIAAVPALGAQLYAAYRLAEDRKAAAHSIALSWSTFAASELELILEGARGILVTLAASPVIRAKDVDRCGQMLSTVRHAHPFFGLLGVLDANGDTVCTGDAASPRLNLSDRPYFKKALASGAFTVGPVIIGRVSGQPAIPLALRFDDLQGQPGGVVFAPLQVDLLANHFREKPLPPGTSISLIARDGTLVLRLPQTELSGGQLVPALRWLLAMEKPGTFESPAGTTIDGGARVVGYVPLSRATADLVVAVGIPREFAFAGMTEVAIGGILLTALTLVVALFAAWLGARSYIDRPIAMLNSVARLWTAGDVGARADERAMGGELAGVATAFNAMAEATETRQKERDQLIEQLRILVGELDHRTKNSLAAVQAMLHQTARSSASLEAFLQAFERRLAAYLKAHELLHEQNWKTTSLKQLVRAVVEPYIGDEQERFEIVGEDAALTPQVALALALAFGELATNAAKYGAFSTQSGRVRLDAVLNGSARAEDQAAPRLILTWTEIRGPLVPNPDRKEGFGSRLLQQLASALNGDVELRFNQLGVVCEISFPHAA
jgi:two-component sensor histidine kinase